MPKTVLITGTSSGYGKATAEHFLARGWNVLATMRRPDPSVFADASGRLTVLPLDVTDERSIDAAIAAGVAARGAIDVWVNNAGVGLGSIVEATPTARSGRFSRRIRSACSRPAVPSFRKCANRGTV